MKQSKVRRKELNGMRAMGEVSWPARRFRYPPMFGNYPRRATVRKARVGGLNTMPTPRRTPDSRRATPRARLIYGAGDQRKRIEPKRSILSRIFSRRKV